jgi:glycosyltransferase involved in cell wall biosynthesis
MATGLPVIVSNQCGCREDLIEEGVNGFGFDARDPMSLGGALDRMWNSRDRWSEMGEASRRIVQNWGVDLFARSFWLSCDAAIRERGLCFSETPTEWAIKALL